jgi:hypothetical protein
MTYGVRVIALSVGPQDEPIFSEQATTITLVDESAGEFVEVSQHGRSDLGKIAINPEEWPELRRAINRMIALCRSAA